MVLSARRVITMGCAVDAAACPAASIKGVEDWGLPDPAGKSIEQVRAIRDTIRAKIASLTKNCRHRAGGYFTFARPSAYMAAGNATYPTSATSSAALFM